MPGNYSHNPITNGTVLDETRYNTDHNNHVTNMTPAGVDDYSANVAQMQLTVSPGDVGSESLATSTAGELERIRFVIKRLLGTTHWYQGPGLLTPSVIDDYSTNAAQMQTNTDPGEVSSESLATTLAGEVERLRFVLKEMKGTAQWYVSTKTKTALPQVLTASTSTRQWNDAVTSNFQFLWYVSSDYESGLVTLYFWRRAPGTGGTAIMNYTLTRLRAGAALTSVGTGTVNFTPANTNTFEATLDIGSANFQVGDVLAWSIERLGADGGDTLAQPVIFDGAWVQYTGFAGRN